VYQLRKLKKNWRKINSSYGTFLSYGTDRIENDTSNISFIVAYLFLAAVMFLPRRCLLTIRGYNFVHRDGWEGFMKYAIEVGTDIVIFIQSFIKIVCTKGARGSVVG
jgi:hypothetical protein